MRRTKPLAFGRWPVALSRQRSAIRMGVLLAVLLLLAGAALADGGYEISWFTVGGGGGEVSGGGFSLSGTVGEPYAGAISGGGYSMVGGFWPGVEALSFRYLPIIMRR